MLLAAASTARAGTFSANFNDGQVPPGSSVVGNTVVEATGGVTNTGVLKITKAINSQAGSFIIEDLDAGAAVYGFSASYMLRLGGGTATPADGYSFNWATDIPDSGGSEEGVGTGLSVVFDIYDNGAGEAPTIDIKWNGATLASTHFTLPQITTTNAFEPVVINLHPSGLLDLAYKGQVVYTNLPVTGFTSLSAARFSLGGRTGGANENQWVDNLQISTALAPEIGIVSQPRGKTVSAGSTTTLKVGLNSTDGVTYQWFKDNAIIPGATSAILTLSNVTLGDDGGKYQVKATGPNNTVTSQEVTLHVVQIDVTGVAKASFNFEDGAVPANTAVYGNALVTAGAGAGGSTGLLLTDANNGETGSFVVNDLDNGAAVTGITVTYNLRVGGGSVPPADGNSFSFGNGLPDDVFGAPEEGAGTGLAVGFDIYDNAGGEAPAIDLSYNGVQIDTVKLPIDVIETGDAFVPVVIQLKNDGTLDVVYNSEVIFHNRPIPGFASISGGRFGWAARTGGLNENQIVDDITIATTTVPGPLHFVQTPASVAALVGKTVTLDAAVNNDTGVTYQWSKNGTAVAGATSSSYTTPALTLGDDQAKYKVTAKGPGNVTIESAEAVVSVVNVTIPTSPKLALNFDNGQVPTNSAVYGNAAVDSGIMKLVNAENGLNGSLIVQPLEGGAEVTGFTAAFKMRTGGGTVPPADGWSFNFANDLPNSTIGGAEDGAGTGITVGFDIYDNGGGEAPSIDVHYGGQVVASTKVPISFIDTGDNFAQVLIQVNPAGTIDVAYNDNVVYHGLALPGFKAIANGRFEWAARTGGLNDNMWLDDVAITTVKSSGPLRFTQQPVSQYILQGQTATLAAVLSDPTGASYVWTKNGTTIAGATGATYTTPALAAGDTGAAYAVKATSPTGTITSTNAVLTVVPPITVSNPNVSFDFNDGAVPAGTTVSGSATPDVTGGVNDSGVMKLTTADNGLSGSFYIEDLNNGAAVSGFTATFNMRVGGGTTPPADGFSFIWANDVTEGTGFGEDGTGSGLVVGFDIYDNGGGEAPSIDVRYGTALMASTLVTIDKIETGDGFAPVAIHVDPAGTLDLFYNNRVIYYHLPLADYAPMAGGLFAFGARTGGLNENQFVDDFKLATTTGTVTPQPKFTSIKSSGGNLTVEWTGGGTLQTASTVTGQWSNVANASSPYSVPAAAAQAFFRIVK